MVAVPQETRQSTMAKAPQSNGSRRPGNACSRRCVLRTLAAGVPCMAVSSWSGCISQFVYRATIRNRRIRVPADHIRPLATPADSLLVSAEGLPGRIAIRRLAADTLVAVLAVCTHRRCPVTPTPDAYSCVCHGSSFDLNGAVTNGPATLPLLSIPITQDGSWFVLHLS